MNITIRDERVEDIATIEALTKSAFLHAEHTSHTEHFIVNQLRKHHQLSISLVAEEEQTIVGHVAVSPVKISSGETGWYGLGPISVLPHKQGLGIGTMLMHLCFSEAEDFRCKGLCFIRRPQLLWSFWFSGCTRFNFARRSKRIFPSDFFC